MSSMWRPLLWLILISVLVGCQAASNPNGDAQRQEQTAAARGEEAAEEQSEPFRPYEYADVPSLETLIFADGFEAYTSEKPYLLGYSYDGDYIATVIYDGSQEGYIVEVTDTLTGGVVYEAFVPHADRIVKGDLLSIDLLTTAQESLNMGYRIQVAPIVSEQGEGVFEQRGSENDVYRFQMSVEDERLFRIAVRDEENHSWFVVNDRAPLNSEQTFIHLYTWAIHPQVPDRVNVMVYTAQEGEAVTPYVYTVNTAALDRRLSEQALSETLLEWLEKPKIVYRYPSTANAYSVLAVEAGDEQEIDRSHLYAGRVSRFALLDQHGEMIVHGNESGVFDHDDRPINDTGEIGQYELSFLPGTTGNAELLIVDVFSDDGEILRTMEWVWSVKDSKFELIGAEETE